MIKSDKITIKEIEQELKKENYKSKYIKVLKSTICTLIVVSSFAAIIVTLIMPVLEISGSSMNPTLTEGEIVLTFKDKNIEQGDIIAFYHGNKILVKRVIATPGSWVNIDSDGCVYVDGMLLEEPYAKEKEQNKTDVNYPYQVPDNSYFVLGDKRSLSIDSRSSLIGSVPKENILGRVIISVWPLNKIGRVK